MRIRAYRATGELDIQAFTLGTRLLLTCNVIGLPEDSEVVSYRWYHSLTGDNQDMYQIQDRDPKTGGMVTLLHSSQNTPSCSKVSGVKSRQHGRQ